MNNTKQTGLEVAVIGMSGRFPGAKTLDLYWDNLKEGVESISTFTEEEMLESGISAERIKDPSYVNARGIIEDVHSFDSSFFDYSPKEAEIMDPQMRIFHELTWEALEDAGYAADNGTHSIGLYVGASHNHYWLGISNFSGKVKEMGQWAAEQLIEKGYLAMRISYKLNLKGPSYTIYTACSTSLVVIHLACQAILCGECDMAMAGGIKITLPQKTGYLYQEGMIFSPDGHCRAFDAEAAGSLGGEGVGIVVLKRLENALADGDHIYATIKGTAINNDGNRKSGFTAPSIEGQVEVIRSALQIAHVEPESIDYIEAHGTGTPIGDPIEVEALKMAFNSDKKKFCALGSVKTNIGHLDAAAGIASFIKTVLAVKHRLIPPSLNFKTPNPQIDFENSPFYVNTKAREWKSNGHPRRAGISSFGIGGTNAHVVLEESPSQQDQKEKHAHQENLESAKRKLQILLFSAKTEKALDKITTNFAKYLKQYPDINFADAAYTLKVGRKAFKHRRMLVLPSAKEAVEVLSMQDNMSFEYFRNVHTYATQQENRPVIFMFSGLGSQYVDMGRGLYEKEPIFRKEMDQCFKILENRVNENFKEILYPSSQPSSEAIIEQLEIAHPVVFILEYALAKLVMAWGIEPRCMIGYSFGEYVAACIAGVFSLEDALDLILYRASLIQETLPGGMLSIPLTATELIPFLNDELSLAIDNGLSCIVSGQTAELENFQEDLKDKRHLCMPVRTSHALHSHLMKPIAQKLADKISQMTLNQPKIPYISNLTGTWLTDSEAKNPQYWSEHLVSTVRFADGIDELKNMEGAIFVEIGPGNDLSNLIVRQLDDDSENNVLNLNRPQGKDVSDHEFLKRKIGWLWLYGVNVNWTTFYSGEKRCRISLPAYPFERHDFSYETKPLPTAGAKISKGRKNDIADWFYTPSWKRIPMTLPKKQTELQESGQRLLIFAGSGTVSQHLEKLLEQFSYEVIIVRPGTGFLKVSNSEYNIDPQQTGDYNNLFETLKADGQIPRRIIHLWSITGDKQGEKNSESQPRKEEPGTILTNGYYSLTDLARAIGTQAITDEMQMVVVTDRVQEVTGKDNIWPEKATILGAVNVIPQEFPNLHCRCIDIDTSITGTKSEMPGNESITKQLLADITSDSPGTMTAYRNNARWEQIFEPINLHPVKPDEDITLLKEKGVYLITGGLGEIGFILAEFLSQYVSGLVLTGRSTFPVREEWDQWLNTYEDDDPISSKIIKIRELEEMGVDILTFSADVSNSQQMNEVVRKTEKQLGPIHGVIHAAGIADGRILLRRTREDSEKIFAAKITGTMVLEEIFKNADLDFLILCSSLNSIVGTMGLAGYCAANAFLDSYAGCVNAAGNSSRFTMTINWDRWQDIGFGRIAEAFHKKFTGNELSGGITAKEGADAFSRLLQNALHRIVVTPNDLPAMLERKMSPQALLNKVKPREERKRRRGRANFPRPELETKFVAPRDRLEEEIVNVWLKIFGIEKIGIYDNFFELGGDSLRAAMFVNRFKEILGEVIHVTAVFDAPTPAAMGEYFKEHYPEEVARLMPEETEQPEENITGTINASEIARMRRLISVRTSFRRQIPEMEDKKNPPAIFVLSSPRSGSTLLRVILGGHPQLFAPPEMVLLQWNTLKERNESVEGKLKKFTFAGPDRAVMEIEQCNVNKAREIIDQLKEQDLTIKEFYNWMQSRLNNRILVDKTPTYTLEIDTLKRAEIYFQDPLYIHLIRHPYGMINSYEKARMNLFFLQDSNAKLPAYSPVQLAELYWTICNQNIVEFLKEVPENRQFLLKYEDLVTQPREIVENMCRFLNLDFSPEMMEPYKEKKQRMTDGFHSEGKMLGDIRFHDHKDIDPNVADKWMKNYKTDFLGDVTNQLAKTFGYKKIREMMKQETS